MQMLLYTLFVCSAVMSVITLIYILAIPSLLKKYSAKWLYYIWLLVVIGWVFPFRPYLNLNIKPVYVPDMQMVQTKYTLINENMNTVSNGTKGAPSFSVWLIAACIWAAGMVGVLVFNIWRHYRFLKMADRWSEEITDQDTILLLNTLKTEMNIKRHIGLKKCLAVSSPMMIGFFTPSVLLPAENNDPEKLKFILWHELIHLKRNDLWYKMLVLLATAVHWFNPVVYFMARVISIQCEVSNDELLVKEISFQQRRQYGETLIGAIRNGTNIHTALSTDFYSGGKTLKTRVFHIMDTTKKKAGFVILCLIFIAVLGSGAAYASDSVYDTLNERQIIKVDVKKLEAGHIICFEGPYQLDGGDTVRYNITSDNNEKLYVDVIRKDTITYGKSVRTQNFIGYYIGYPMNKITVSHTWAGEYCLLVKFRDLEGAQNIKGTIEIIKGKDKD